MTTQTEKALMRALKERDEARIELEDFKRGHRLTDVVSNTLQAEAIDRIIAERAEYKYYMNMYKELAERLLTGDSNRISRKQVAKYYTKYNIDGMLS